MNDVAHGAREVFGSGVAPQQTGHTGLCRDGGGASCDLRDDQHCGDVAREPRELCVEPRVAELHGRARDDRHLVLVARRSQEVADLGKLGDDIEGARSKPDTSSEAVDAAGDRDPDVPSAHRPATGTATAMKRGSEGFGPVDV